MGEWGSGRGHAWGRGVAAMDFCKARRNYRPRSTGSNVLATWRSLLKTLSTDGVGPGFKEQVQKFKEWNDTIISCSELTDLTFCAYQLLCQIPSILNATQRKQAAKSFQVELQHKRKGFVLGDDLAKALSRLLEGEMPIVDGVEMARPRPDRD